MKAYRHVWSLRDGSRVDYWPVTGDVVEGILEINPDYPPRVHFPDDRGTVELVPVQVPVMHPPRHEHMPVIAGQEYPRDISPIDDRTIVETKWTLPVKARR